MLKFSLSQRNKSRGISTWYARIFDTETKLVRFESLGTTKKTEAMDVLHDLRSRGHFDNINKKRYSLREAFRLYLNDCEARGVSLHCLQCLENDLKSLYSLYDRDISTITKQDVVDAFNFSMVGLKPSSYNHRKTCVRTAFKYAINVLEAILTNPADGLKSRKDTQAERSFWTPEQIYAILNATNDSNYRLLWAFMAFAGLRIHEALKVKFDDLQGGNLVTIGKGNKFAKLPISAALRSELDRVNNTWDFSKITNALAYIKLKNIVAIALGSEAAGNSYPHKFRHSFASNLIKAGVNIKSVQKLMRHSKIATTLDIYSHVADNDLADDLEKMIKKI